MDLKLSSTSETLLEMFIIIKMYCNEKIVKLAPLRKITINRTDVYQEIFGFGGAVTDSAAINIHSLTHETSEHLLRYNKS